MWLGWSGVEGRVGEERGEEVGGWLYRVFYVKGFVGGKSGSLWRVLIKEVWVDYGLRDGFRCFGKWGIGFGNVI